MADSTSAAVSVASVPSSDDLERAEEFTREPFLHEGETPEDALAPGTARRRALDAALAELDAGAEYPRCRGARPTRCCSASSACSRRTSPSLADGTILTGHQVDALSGTLTALLAEAQRAAANGNGAGPSEAELAELASSAIPGEEEIDEAEDEPDEEPQDWDEDAPEDEDAPAGRAARGPQRRPALLVRARDRRRQDGRRARLRRGLAHRRHPDPHPPPQPRRPVPRRAARPRLRQAHRAGAARRQGPGQRPGDGRDLPVVRAQRRPASPTPTRSSSATRRTPRSARRRPPRSAPGPARSSSA